MLEGTTITTLKLPNGVSLTWPSSLGQLELSGSAHKLVFFIDHQNPVSTGQGYRPGTVGITLSNSKEDGSSQAESECSTGGGCGCT